MSQQVVRQLQDAAAAYVSGSIDAATLEGRLADLALDVSEHDDDENALHSLMWLLLSEYDRGHRDEASLRRSLQDAISTRRAP
jgi:hypothetical protein